MDHQRDIHLALPTEESRSALLVARHMVRQLINDALRQANAEQLYRYQDQLEEIEDRLGRLPL